MGGAGGARAIRSNSKMMESNRGSRHCPCRRVLEKAGNGEMQHYGKGGEAATWAGTATEGENVPHTKPFSGLSVLQISPTATKYEGLQAWLGAPFKNYGDRRQAGNFAKVTRLNGDRANTTTLLELLLGLDQSIAL